MLCRCNFVSHFWRILDVERRHRINIDGTILYNIVSMLIRYRYNVENWLKQHIINVVERSIRCVCHVSMLSRCRDNALSTLCQLHFDVASMSKQRRCCQIYYVDRVQTLPRHRNNIISMLCRPYPNVLSMPFRSAFDIDTTLAYNIVSTLYLSGSVHAYIPREIHASKINRNPLFIFLASTWTKTPSSNKKCISEQKAFHARQVRSRTHLSRSLPLSIAC